MSVKPAQITKTQADFWRKLYIRLLTEPIVGWMQDAKDFTPNQILELEAIEDLVDAGYLRGKVEPASDGRPCCACTRGPTLAGRVFAETQQDILDRKSLWWRIKSGTGIFVGWIGGLISSLIIYRLTHPHL